MAESLSRIATFLHSERQTKIEHLPDDVVCGSGWEPGVFGADVTL